MWNGEFCENGALITEQWSVFTKFSNCNKKPYVECYLNKKYLTGITVICSPDTKGRAQKDADGILNYISERNYKAIVGVEVFGK